MTSYHRPATLEDALSLVRTPNSIALAGGGLAFGQHDLPYEVVIDLAALPAVNEITVTDDAITVGAAVMLADIANVDGLPAIVRQAITRAIVPNLRNNISIREAWLHRSSRLIYELDAALKLISDDFGGSPIVPPDVPLRPVMARRFGDDVRFGASFVARTPTDSPIVCAAVRVHLDGDIVAEAVAAVAGVNRAEARVIALSTLAGQPLDEANIASTVRVIATEVTPFDDFLGSAAYRKTMAEVCVQRALAQAAQLSSST